MARMILIHSFKTFSSYYFSYQLLLSLFALGRLFIVIKHYSKINLGSGHYSLFVHFFEVERTEPNQFKPWSISISQYLQKNTCTEVSFCVCLESRTLRNCLSPSYFLHHFSGITGNLEQKKYFTEHRTANTNQLFVAIKQHFFDLSFLWTFSREREIPRDYLDKSSHLFICTSLK